MAGTVWINAVNGDGESAIRSRARDVGAALTTWPSRGDWTLGAGLYVMFLVGAVPIGIVSGLLHPSLPPLSAGGALVTALTILLHPAFSEELVFRVLLLPRRLETVSRSRLYITIAIALFLYVVAHPLNAYFFWPAAMPIFGNPFYLAMTTLLGLTCITAYLMSGSIWLPALIHWLTVTLWLLLLGGQALLQYAS
jgi:predicted Abi (CAAX) family protease